MPKPMWDELKFRKDQSFHRQTARLFNHDLLVDEFDLLVEKSRGLSIALLASRIIAWGSVFMIDLASVLAFGTSGPAPYHCRHGSTTGAVGTVQLNEPLPASGGCVHLGCHSIETDTQPATSHMQRIYYKPG